jgi:L-threonylcarbamoyladenylate synthase
MIVPPTPSNLDRAAQLLRDGALVSFPTETVYGLGADARNDAAVRRIFAAKQRPSEHPVIVHIADAATLDRWARSVPRGARALAAAFWPGPLTLILPRAPGVSDVVTGGADSVGLRVPGNAVARELLAHFVALGGEGIAAPSANRFGRVSATTAQHVADDFGAELALILDGGACTHGIESTIVAFTGAKPALLRLGAIPADRIEAVLEARLEAAGPTAPRASGTLASHYAPRTPARLFAPNDLRAALASRPGAHVAVLAHSMEQPPSFEGVWFDAPAHNAAYARELYANLRALDALAADEIWIEAPPDGPEWSAVRDRLRRATHRD